ncbi:uncharacterized protein LOC111134855 isoform X5 [Crassostrea virginica]|uniref:Uncharacterized protein LOC111134855 isoform X5 n=1 Tax=Crassostrea virginica TaxID=6565 RepID=A0A8B8EKG9_CRAVI|nr:uncharacterized protein LOC111134855 isoform X5 [Crassostrea virginica]
MYIYRKIVSREEPFQKRPSKRDGVTSRSREAALQDSVIVCCSTENFAPEAGYFTETPDSDDSMVGQTAFSRLDPATLKYIGWAPNDVEPRDFSSDPAESAKNDKNYENLCRLSKVEFKKLTDQVKDVSMNLRNRFRTSAYQMFELPYTVTKAKLYQQPSAVENGSQIYRSQLAASLKAFKPKDWAPLDYREKETTFLRCRPIQQPAQPDRTRTLSVLKFNRSRSFLPTIRAPTPPPSRCQTQRLRRPRSVPANARRCDTPCDVRPGPFDSLNPRVLSTLIGDSYKPHTFGDRIPDDNEKEEDSDEKVKSEKSRKSKEQDEDNSTSGIESSQTEDESSGSSSDDEDSDYEPEVDKNREVPDLILRPEKLDSFVVPDSSKGWRKYDFDAEHVDIPPYEFADPIPEPFNDLDLRQMARLKWNWRDHTRAKAKDNVDLILDRLVELERLQLDTEEWENKRYAQVNRKSKRAASAKPVIRDRRCCNRCLQPACAGDCPEKNVQFSVCECCRQTFCVSSQCKETKYEQRMRQPRIDEEKPQQMKPLPRACKSCQIKNNAKLINANNLVLGRPKSGNATFARGQSSCKPRDLRPRPDTPVSPDIVKDFEKLGLQAHQPPKAATPTQRMQRPRSRNAIIPGKTFYSQRRDSISENEKETLTNLKRKKMRSIRVRRPKTAV